MGKHSDEGHTRRSISAPPSFWERVDQDAKKNGLDRSSYIRFIVSQYYDLKANGTPTPQIHSVVA